MTQAVQYGYNMFFAQGYTNVYANENGSFMQALNSKTEEISADDLFNAANIRKDKADKSEMEPLDYYHSLCKEFPDITFRLYDKEESLKRSPSEPPYIGYNNSFNQVGENFGYNGHTSIAIDVSIIRKMQKDPELETYIKEEIKNMRERTPSEEKKWKGWGVGYISFSIEQDKNGEPLFSCGGGEGNIPPATEEEVRAKWGMDKIKKNYETIMLSLGINDKFYEMLDKAIEEARERREKIPFVSKINHSREKV